MKKIKDVVNPKYQALPHQREGIIFMLNHHYSINGDDMGLGKSFQAIVAALITESKFIVVCPTYLKYNWVNEINKFSKESLNGFIFDSRTPFAQLSSGWDYAIVPYSMLHKPLVKPLFAYGNMVIGDEIQYTKSMTPRRSKSLHKLLKEVRPERFVGLSGTVIENRVTEWYSPLVLCSYTPHPTNGYDVTYFFKNQYAFNTRFSLLNEFKVKGRQIRKWYGLKNEDNLKKILDKKYLRRLTEEAIDLPDLIRKDILFEIGGDKKLVQAWKSHESGLKDAHIMRAKAESALLKTPATISYVKDLIDSGSGPVVIFSDHVKPVQAIYDGLSKRLNGAMITGSTSIERRQEVVDMFQKGELDYLVATIGSSSTGITLTRGRHLVFNDLSWVPALLAQAEKRIHRIGQDFKCIIHRIVGSTMDAKITKQLTEKIEVLKRAL